MSLMSESQNENTYQMQGLYPDYGEFVKKYVSWVAGQPVTDAKARQAGAIARSADSAVVAALLNNAEILRENAVTLRIVLADLGSGDEFRSLAEGLSAISKDDAVHTLVRWARHADLREAHEQLALGSRMCWTGDCIRREPGKRDSLNLFETEAPRAANFAALSFRAIWSASEPVALSRFGFRPAKPSAAFSGEHVGSLSAYSTLNKTARANTTTN